MTNPKRDPNEPIPSTARHGTVHTYNKYGCRCGWCQTAKREYAEERRIAGEWMEASDPRHATNTGYTAGCRCQPCRDAHSQYARAYRERMKHNETCPCIECKIKRAYAEGERAARESGGENWRNRR